MTFYPTFSTRSRDAGRYRTLYVEGLNAFPDPVANVITLEANTTYIFSQAIDFGLNQIQIPTNGDVTLETTNPVSNTIATDLPASTPLFIGQIGRFALLGLDVTSTNGCDLFDVTGGVGVLTNVFYENNRFLGFGSLGTIDGASVLAENSGYFNNGGGLTINNAPIIQMAEQNFVLQTGDHLIFTGTSAAVTLSDMVGSPSTGDQLFNADALTVTGNFFISNPIFNDVNGGTTGLVKTYAADQTLDNIFRDIRVDTTSNAVEIELPDTTASTVEQGYTIFISDTGNAATNNVTIIPNGSDSTTINNGLTRYRITENNGQLVVVYAHGTWEIFNRNNQNSISPTLTATSTLAEIDNVVIANTGGGAFTTTLPTAVGRRGKFVVLKKLEGINPRWTVVPQNGEFIDNSIELRFNGGGGRAATLMSDGQNWIIIEAT